MSKQAAIIVPEGCERVLLHACCAPCSSAIVEWLTAHGITPVIYYYNPNIYPLQEYELRKNESKRHAESLGIQWIDGDRFGTGAEQQSIYQEAHRAWWHDICKYSEENKNHHPELEPERGKRCEVCFYHRLLATAQMAKELEIPYFATTLASSRWKSLEQINRAGEAAAKAVSDQHSAVSFWAQNWRKDGLQERRNELLKAYEFYNQTYCGCEFSMHAAERTAVVQHAE